MAAQGDDPQGLISGINITPFVDVTLVLMIIFIVTAKVVVTPAVPLDLPKSTRASKVQVVFSVIVPVRGPTLVNGERVVDDAALVRAAKAALADHPELRAVIHADGGVKHRRVLKTLDLLRDAGISRVAFAALPEGDGAR
ncbi:MAG: biopolymer transporter ExbD [Myxococcales bacterium]|nr:biopolymer transporter ExbD [Myxococcales bacterium]